MVDISMEGAPHEYWAEKDYWSDRDLLNICWGGLENLTQCDDDEFSRMKNTIKQAVVSGELKEEKSIAGEIFFKRDNAVKWASQNLKHFPFEPEDFSPVQKKNHPGTNKEETLLRMIGALAILISEKNAIKYKSGNKPNFSQIAEDTYNKVRELNHEAIKQEEKKEVKEHFKIKGLKSSNLRAIISQGFKLLQE
ncbi:MAG: hypothetical protein ACRBDI_10565 [Alphaproteobacteria bacterium]